jgi:electron transport complex protein RnfB
MNPEIINELLPQTQCGECSYKGCKPYAEAMARGEVEINRCVPGGVKTLQSLGELLKIDAAPYIEAMKQKYRPPSVAWIEESLCIGCTKCIQACPVDAIVGTGKLMHTIISDECTGCGLCIEPCPMDCIHTTSLPERSHIEEKEKSIQWKARYEAHNIRLEKLKREKQIEHEKARLVTAKKLAISEAIARAKAKREAV